MSAEDVDVDLSSDLAATLSEMSGLTDAIKAMKVRRTALEAVLAAVLGDDPESETVHRRTGMIGGQPVYEINVYEAKRLDATYLKRTHPAVYAECETRSLVRRARILTADE